MNIERYPRLLRYSISFCLCLLLSACATTTPVYEWRDQAFTGEAFQHVLVIGVSENYARRRLFEDSFAEKLSSIGARATASASIMPGEQQIEKEAVKKVISGSDIDAVIVTHLVGVEEEEAYVPAPQPIGPRYPIGPTYYGYYATAYNNAYQPGYYEKYRVVKLETNLYDVKTEKPVWSMQSQTVEPDQINTLIDEIIQLNIQSLRKQNLF